MNITKSLIIIILFFFQVIKTTKAFALNNQILSISKVSQISTNLKKQDEFLEIIKEAQSKNIRIFDHPNFFTFLRENLSDIESLIIRWYPTHGTELISKVKKTLGSEYIVLLFDPGIVCRIDTFLEFAKMNSKLDLVFLRIQFSNQLGSQTLLRGLKITSKQADEIKKNGLTAPSLLLGRHTNKIEKYFLNLFSLSPIVEGDDYDANSPLEEVNARRGGLNREFSALNYGYMSFTKITDIAIAVADHYGRDEDFESKIFVVKTTLPILSIIEPTGAFDPIQNKSLSRTFDKDFAFISFKLENKIFSDLLLYDPQKNISESEFYALPYEYDSIKQSDQLLNLEYINYFKNGKPIFLLNGLNSLYIQKSFPYSWKSKNLEIEVFIPYLVSPDEIQSIDEHHEKISLTYI